MSYKKIHNLLDARLATVTGLPPLSKENIRVEPKTGVAYSRTTLLPTEPTALSTETNDVSGLFQIDLFYPMDKGADDADAMVDAVVAAFGRGLVLTDNTITVHIRMAWRETALPFQQFYNTPVVVRWTSLLAKG